MKLKLYFSTSADSTNDLVVFSSPTNVDEKVVTFSWNDLWLLVSIGAAVTFFFFTPVFSSLKHLKKQVWYSHKDFSTEIENKRPIRISRAGSGFNDVSHNLQATFNHLMRASKKREWWLRSSLTILKPHYLHSVTVDGNSRWRFKEEGAITT